MKLKLDEAGHATVLDGKPVYVADDGKEVAFDYAATLGTISRLNGEAKGHRERAEAADARAKLFEGIEDPEAARKALSVVKNLDDKKLVDAGEVERIKTELTSALDAKYKPVVKERDGLKDELHREKIGGSFARSKFIGEKLAIPPDMVEAAFGKHFSLVDGKVVAKGPDGNTIYSRANPGELAGFDEAVEMLVNAYPHRDSILKGTGASGSGAIQSSGKTGGPKVITRTAFDALDPMTKAAKMKEGFTLTDA
jgi:hypothetical protein